MTQHENTEHEVFSKELQKPNKLALQPNKLLAAYKAKTFEHFQLESGLQIEKKRSGADFSESALS